MPDLNTSGYSPLQASGATPQQNLSQAQQEADLDRQIQLRRLTQGQDIANRGYEQAAQAYGQEGQDYSALKDLLLKTQERLGSLQYGPSKQEQALRTMGAIAGEKPSLQGMAGVGAAAAQAGAQGMQETRAGELQKQQLMAKYGIDAQQAGIMAHQLQSQLANNMVNRGQQMSNNASTALNSNLGRQISAAKDQGGMDAGLVAELAKAKAEATIQGQLAGANGAGGQGGDQQDPIAEARARYAVPFPAPTARATPLQRIQYQQDLQKVLALNPEFQEGNYAIANKVRQQFDTDANHGDKLRFINNVMGHIDTYDKLMGAMKQAGQTGDYTLVNRLVQQFGAQTGHPELTSAQAVQGFLGDELVNSIVPRGGTGAERESQEGRIRTSLAPQQWGQVRDTYKDVLTTQVADLERQYRSSLNFLPKELLDKEFYGDPQKGAMGKVTPEVAKLLQNHHQSTGAASYSTKDAVIADYKAGKLTRDQAKHVLQQNGWAQ